jgi:hypothetical protein
MGIGFVWNASCGNPLKSSVNRQVELFDYGTQTQGADTTLTAAAWQSSPMAKASPLDRQNAANHAC